MFDGLRDGLMSKLTPCKNCDKRTPGCHDRCSEYISWSIFHENEKESIRAEKHKYQQLDTHEIEAKQKAKRRHGDKK